MIKVIHMVEDKRNWVMTIINFILYNIGMGIFVGCILIIPYLIKKNTLTLILFVAMFSIAMTYFNFEGKSFYNNERTKVIKHEMVVK